jgi:hypothetical protein
LFDEEEVGVEVIDFIDAEDVPENGEYCIGIKFVVLEVELAFIVVFRD